MKAFKWAIVMAILFFGVQSFAQEGVIKKESFKVWGNCEMCKSTIEKAAKSTDGVKSAKWNVSKKTILVKYDSSKTSLEVIKKKIIASGYDTEEFKASEESYNGLHGCCKYDRK